MTAEAKMLQQMHMNYKIRIRQLRAQVKDIKRVMEKNPKDAIHTALGVIESQCAYMEGAMEGLSRYETAKD